MSSSLATRAVGFLPEKFKRQNSRKNVKIDANIELQDQPKMTKSCVVCVGTTGSGKSATISRVTGNNYSKLVN